MGRCWGPALSTVLTFSILAWTYKLSTTSRFAVPSAKTGGTIASYFLAPSVGIMLAVIHTNSMNLYPSTVDLVVVLNNVHKPTRWEQPLATIGLGILGTVLAIAGILRSSLPRAAWPIGWCPARSWQ
jgi:purine-cytosine permease-like protein